MNILERDLEEIIYESWASDGGAAMIERGLAGPRLLGGDIFRQVRMPGLGVLDLLIVKPELYNGVSQTIYHIIELKRGVIDISAYQQLCRYVSTVSHAMHETSEVHENNYVISGVLVGAHVEDADWLHQVFVAGGGQGQMGIAQYKLDINTGLRFKHLRGFYKTSADLGGISEVLRDMADNYASEPAK